jgi:hypothetical protein
MKRHLASRLLLASATILAGLVGIAIGPAGATGSAPATVTTSPNTVQTVVNSGTTNSLCINPSGVTSFSGPQSPSLTSYSNTNGNCDAPAALAGLTNPVVEDPSSTSYYGYGTALPGSNWVGIASDASDSQNSTSFPAFYIYDAEFTLPDCYTAASVSGSMMADNAVGVYLNNNFLQADANAYSSSNFMTPLAFTTSNPSFFTSPTNVLDFVVDDSSGDATGLDLSATVTYTSCAPTNQTTVVSGGTNSLCINPKGIASSPGAGITAVWGDGGTPPSSLPNGGSPLCNPPTSLASLTSPMVEGPPGSPPTSSGCAYSGSIPGASWVGIESGCSDSLNPPPAAENSNKMYIYDAEFSMPSCYTNASISGLMEADNGAAAYLNNNLIGYQSIVDGGGVPNFSNPAQPFGPTSSFIAPGTNILDFLVEDHSVPQTGLDFSATITYTSCSVTYGQSVSDFATVTGNTTDGSPTGSVTFYACGPTTTEPTSPACTSSSSDAQPAPGNPVPLTAATATTSTASSGFFTPDATGWWCFAGYYSGDSNYSAASDTTTDECLEVDPDPTSTVSTPSGSIASGQSETDTATVTDTGTGGSPTGSVSFYECGPNEAPTPCTSTANPVGGAVDLTPGPGTTTATATSEPFTPDASGYWCLAEYYTGATDYAASSDTTFDGCFDVTSPTITAALASGTTMNFNGDIDGTPITMTCTNFTTSGNVTASTSTLKISPPTISGCTDSLGGTDTIATNGKWKLKASSGEVKLSIPEKGATFKSSVLSGCTLTAAPTGTDNVGAADNYNNNGVITYSSDPITVSGKGCTAKELEVTATVDLTPNPGTLPPW